MVSNEFQAVLVDGVMLSKAQWRHMEDVLRSIDFPSRAGRLPSNVSLFSAPSRYCLTILPQIATNPSLKKADELRTWSIIAPAVLYVVWKDDDDRLPDTAQPIPPNTKARPSWDRNPRQIYQLILRLSVALRVLALRAISLDECNAAVEDIRQYCRLRLLYGIALTISHHLAMHYQEFFRRYGPAYAMWLFAFEALNGLLKKINTNRRGAGEMELTFMRSWIRYQLLSDLVSSMHVYPIHYLTHFIAGIPTR